MEIKSFSSEDFSSQPAPRLQVLRPSQHPSQGLIPEEQACHSRPMFMLLAQKRTVHYFLNGLKEANTGFYNSPKKKKERKKKQQFLKTENAFFAASKDFFIQKINGYMEHHRKVYILATYFHSLLNRGTSTRKQVLCSHPLKCFTRVYWRKVTRRWLSNVSPLI